MRVSELRFPGVARQVQLSVMLLRPAISFNGRLRQERSREVRDTMRVGRRRSEIAEEALASAWTREHMAAGTKMPRVGLLADASLLRIRLPLGPARGRLSGLPRRGEIWETAPVTISVALHRALALIALVGLVLAPLTAPAMARGTASMAVMSAQDGEAVADMPCCPPEKPVMPDCQKACPLAALCLAKCFSGLVSASAVPNRLGVALAMISGDEAAPDTLAHGPPPRPPQS
jgi:hypothetical protein